MLNTTLTMLFHIHVDNISLSVLSHLLPFLMTFLVVSYYHSEAVNPKWLFLTLLLLFIILDFLFIANAWWLVTSSLLSVTLKLHAKYFSGNSRYKFWKATSMQIIMTCFALSHLLLKDNYLLATRDIPGGVALALVSIVIVIYDD